MKKNVSKFAPGISKDTALLPSGFVDLLAPEANAEAKAIAVLVDEFVSFGYERVKPPLIEFEVSLLGAGGSGAMLADDTFRVMDPISHKMMGVRSDITPQIARLARSRLAQDARPLRVSYSNDVLRTRGSQYRTERQFCQVGCEIIGSESTQADIEAIVVALVGLKRLGLSDITVDLCVPRLVDYVLEAAPLSEDIQGAIKEAVDRKDIDGIRDLDAQMGAVFSELFAASGTARDVMDPLLGVALPSKAAALVVKLYDVCRGVIEALDVLGYDDVSLTIDSLEFKGFDYQSDVAFTFFSAAVRGEIGRGGRYQISDESAVGFTLYMDTVRSAMVAGAEPHVKEVPAETGWDEILAMKSDGFVVKRRL